MITSLESQIVVSWTLKETPGAQQKLRLQDLNRLRFSPEASGRALHATSWLVRVRNQRWREATGFRPLRDLWPTSVPLWLEPHAILLLSLP
jgi:hypothetical protein